jgi:hypothetical protein
MPRLVQTALQHKGPRPGTEPEYATGNCVMPLSRLTERDLRDACRARLEMLELWLRRLIHEQFEQMFSNDILHAKNAAGEFVLKKQLREHLEKHLCERPGRYKRPIDAAMLEDLITIICKPDTYKSCFATALAVAFPLGNEEARDFLNRLLTPRNHLSHANPVSIRQAEQVICYSNDVVYALRDFYAMRGTAEAYNVPRILRMWDSFGHVEHVQATQHNIHIFDYSGEHASHLRPGDTLTIEIEVDPSFLDEGFMVKWSSFASEFQRDERLVKLVLPIENKHVGRELPIDIQIISHQGWHRHQLFDDLWRVIYRVLPPI